MLLQVAASCHPSVTALHINHQLQPNHQQTEQFCRRTCERLGVELGVQRVLVEVKDTGAGGLEEAARAARYDEFRKQLGRHELMLTELYTDVQTDAVLFRLLRHYVSTSRAGMSY